jgi:hypothetical protein
MADSRRLCIEMRASTPARSERACAAKLVYPSVRSSELSWPHAAQSLRADAARVASHRGGFGRDRRGGRRHRAEHGRSGGLSRAGRRHASPARGALLRPRKSWRRNNLDAFRSVGTRCEERRWHAALLSRTARISRTLCQPSDGSVGRGARFAVAATVFATTHRAIRRLDRTRRRGPARCSSRRRGRDF